jgi:hypothetical protein
MRSNLFRFGDTFWLQETGTAMGYATVYYSIHKLRTLLRANNHTSRR